MAVTSKSPTDLTANLLGAAWTGHDIRVVLLKATYTPDQDNHSHVDDLDLATHEATGTGYAAGGEAIAGKSVAKVSASNKNRFLGDPVEWPGSTVTNIRYAAVIDADEPLEADQIVLSVMDLGANKSTVGTTFTVNPDPDDGWVRGVVA